MDEWYNDPTLQSYFKSIEGFKRISHNREKELSIIIQTGENEKDVEAAKEELITANLNLVVKFAIKYMNGFHASLDIMDLISIGNTGLIKSVDIYDSRHASKSVFSTLAVHAITRRMERAIKMDAMVHIPMHHWKWRKKISDLEEKYGNSLTDEIIIEEIGIHASLLEKVKDGINSKPFSLEEIQFGESGTWEDIVEGMAENIEEKIFGKSLMQFLEQHIKKLSSKEQDVMHGLFFISNPLTLEQLGIRYGLSKERIRQIREESLIKLRRSIIDEIDDKVITDIRDLKILDKLKHVNPHEYRIHLKKLREKEKQIASELIFNFEEIF